jgi:aspartyl-tRNA(Asn)/glutamyl-tRNA(Gln) amidotransferase subunit B
MSQGSMRFDVNISLRPKGEEKLGTRTETKNLNSFKFMEDAIHLEVQRQQNILEEGGRVIQETRLYDGVTGTARSMRSKEEANDYRYFPCPDLLPVEVDEATIEALRQTLPELPDQRQARLAQQYNLSEYDAAQLSADAATARYFEAVVSTCTDAKLAANWVMGELSALLNRNEISISASPIPPAQLGELINAIREGVISGKIAKQLFDALANGEGDVKTIIEAKGYRQVSDEGALEKIIADVIANNPGQVEQYRNAEPDKRKKMTGFFVGQIMKASGGQANPAVVNKLLSQKLDG